jgi:S1-C subfamily serine protease
MRRIKLIGRGLIMAGILGASLVGGLWVRRSHIPHPRVNAPTTHYHGYDLNAQAIRRVRGLTVLISKEGFAGISRGTGVLIDSTHVLTCAHMVDSMQDDLWIYPYPGAVVVKGRPVHGNRSVDLAILELSAPVVIPHYAVFQEEHYDGEPITIIGNTLGAMQWFVSFGIVSGEWQDFLLTDGVLYGGNSGGPWLNERGEIVALTDWTLEDKHGVRTGIHGGVAAKTVNKFLKDWKEPPMFSIQIGLSR